MTKTNYKCTNCLWSDQCSCSEACEYYDDGLNDISEEEFTETEIAYKNAWNSYIYNFYN